MPTTHALGGALEKDRASEGTTEIRCDWGTDGTGLEFPITQQRILFPATHPERCTQAVRHVMPFCILISYYRTTPSTEILRLRAAKWLATTEHKYSQMNFWHFCPNIFGTRSREIPFDSSPVLFRSTGKVPSSVSSLAAVKRSGNIPSRICLFLGHSERHGA